MPNAFAGIDAGASLWKLVRVGEELETVILPVGAVEKVRRRIADWAPDRIGLTGGGTARLVAVLEGRDLRPVSEFEAWARGAPVLAGRAGWTLPPRYLLVSLGTGTSALAVEDGIARRVGGTALGGGTLLGLARLLCRVDSFAEIVALAARGDRGRVDLRVGDVYPEGDIPLPPELTASNFAKLASREPADLAHALLGLVGENVGIPCAAMAAALGIDTLVFGGGVLEDNPQLEEILRRTVELSGREARFLPHGAFCGAVGAAVGGNGGG